MSTGEGGKEECAMLRGAGMVVDWCGRQEGVWTAEGDWNWCSLVRGTGSGVDW